VSKRAAIYVRISQDRAGAGLGVGRQADDCRALANRMGWDVIAVHVDNDASASTGKRRPAYESLLVDVDSGRVDVVVVWHTDRLHRSPIELERYIGICDPRGVATHSVQAGEQDLSTPSGRMVARMLGAAARYEVEHKAERTRRAQAQAAAAGKWLGGGRPFGWRLLPGGGAELDEVEADVVRDASRNLLAGLSLGSMVEDLDARGIRTSTGRTWSYTSLRQVVSRARNAGLVELHGEIVAASQWPAILEEEVWRAVVSTLADPGRRRSQSNRVRWLLAGIARCVCGAPCRSGSVSGAHGRASRAVYRCRQGGPGHVARSAEPVDALVTEVILAMLSRPDAVDILTADSTAPDAQGLRTEAMALRQRLIDAADLWETGDLPTGDYRDRAERLRARLAVVEAGMAGSVRMAALAPLLTPGDKDSVRVAWGRYGIPCRRCLLRQHPQPCVPVPLALTDP